MKTKGMILSCLIGAVVLSMRYGYGQADAEADRLPLKIGVVSIQRIFQDSKRSMRYRKEDMAKQQGFEAELERLTKGIEADKAGLKTLRVGSGDHLALLQQIFEKQGRQQALQETYRLQRALMQQRMVEELYEDVLLEIEAVAKEKSLDLVFEKSVPRFPAQSTEELERVMDSNKLLYSNGCLDITGEVMARIDAKENEKQNGKNLKP